MTKPKKIYKVYTDLGDGGEYMCLLYTKAKTALKDLHGREKKSRDYQDNEEHYMHEVEVITE